MNYYNKIKNELIDNEITKKAKDYSKNRSDLMHYYNVGKLLIDAGKHYGERIIANYSIRLIKEVDGKYNTTNLKRFRQFYLLIEKGATMWHQLSWSHYKLLISLHSIEKINYYSSLSVKNNYSVRQLESVIKYNDYERVDDKTKTKLINKENISVVDFVRNPIVVRNSLNIDEVTEKYLKKLILENISDFMEQLGDGFSFIKDEYKIKIGDKLNYIDILLFNYMYNSFVVVELKVTELKKEHIGQIEIYMNYIDKHIKSINHDKTIGIIICKHDNKLYLEYCSDKRIFSTTYEITC